MLPVQVRIAAAQQLPVLGRILSPPAVMKEIIPELKELLEDDEVQVGMAADATHMELMQQYSPACRSSYCLTGHQQHAYCCLQQRFCCLSVKIPATNSRTQLAQGLHLGALAAVVLVRKLLQDDRAQAIHIRL